MRRAIVVHGRLSDPSHIELNEPVTEITGEVEVVVQPATLHSRSPSTGAARTLASMAARARARVPAQEWSKLPRDGAVNTDHYLYGAPKEDEEGK